MIAKWRNTQIFGQVQASAASYIIIIIFGITFSIIWLPAVLIIPVAIFAVYISKSKTLWGLFDALSIKSLIVISVLALISPLFLNGPYTIMQYVARYLTELVFLISLFSSRYWIWRKLGVGASSKRSGSDTPTQPWDPPKK